MYLIYNALMLRVKSTQDFYLALRKLSSYQIGLKTCLSEFNKTYL